MGLCKHADPALRTRALLVTRTCEKDTLRAFDANPSFQLVGSARRSGPKLQARSAVCGEWGGFAARMGRLGEPSQFFFEWRCRANCVKGERPSLACGMRSLFHQARSFGAMAWKPHRRETQPCACTGGPCGVKIPNSTGERRPCPPLLGAAAPIADKSIACKSRIC